MNRTSYVKPELFVSFPFTYPSLNEILAMGWRLRNGRKEAFAQEVAKILAAHPPVKFPGAVKVWIDLTFPDKRRRDKDNYSPKWLLDCLVRKGIIQDDNAKIIPAPADIEFFYETGVRGMTLKVEGIV